MPIYQQLIDPSDCSVVTAMKMCNYLSKYTINSNTGMLLMFTFVFANPVRKHCEF